jgi:hypothetical protein
MGRPRRKWFSRVLEDIKKGARYGKKSKGNIVRRKKVEVILITEFFGLYPSSGIVKNTTYRKRYVSILR